MTRPPPDAARVEEIAHLTLLLGRLLLLNGADTQQVHDSAARFAAAFGCEANLLVTYEALLVTLVAGEDFRTKIGHRVPGMNVGMAALDALNRMVDAAEAGHLTLAQARAALEAVEHRPAVYPRWLIVLGLGVTTASLSRLFGGDWGACAIAGVAGLVGSTVRLELPRHQVNAVLAAFIVAWLSGIAGGIGVLVGATATPALCLVAPGMVLVPGVPLINGVQDMIRNHVTLGVSRLAFACTVIAAIAVGLFAATVVTGVTIPVNAPTVVIGVPQDALFSALAAAGFALLFSVPLRLAWACLLCGVASHSLRALLFHDGIDIVAGSLLGALAVGVLAQGFAYCFRAPATAFAFAGIVAMIPGAYAFRAVIASLEIVRGTASAPLVAETVSLIITVVLMVLAIAIGIAAPALLFAPLRRRR